MESFLGRVSFVAPGRGREIIFGITVAWLAVILALDDLGAGKFGSEELKLTNEKASGYLWYWAKSIKEALVEGQKDLLEALMRTQEIEEGRASFLREGGQSENGKKIKKTQ